jgi:hypothetical protein
MHINHCNKNIRKKNNVDLSKSDLQERRKRNLIIRTSVTYL